MSDGWDREELGLPPAPLSAHNHYYDEGMDGLGAKVDGPMLCTEGRLRPCPYCESDDVNTYTDGTAQCNSCRRWYKYIQSWL